MSSNDHLIIIVGSGKAAMLHLDAYIRLWHEQERPIIYIIAGNVIEVKINEIVKKHPLHIQFIAFNKVDKLNRSYSLVDICTPTQTHKSVIQQMFNIGFFRFLVEKPLVTTIKDIEWITSLNIRIEVMQNYKFSQATTRTLELLKSDNIIPKFMLSFFCKDRTHDTLHLRGFSNAKPPHVFTIELPHQLYLASLFLGFTKYSSCYAQLMQVGQKKYPEHGFGSISLEHSLSDIDGLRLSNSMHFSCLFSKKSIKRVQIIGHDTKIITIDYPSIKGILTSKIRINIDGGTIYEEVFENDDMIRLALGYYYNKIFSDNSTDTARYYYPSMNDTLLLIDALSKSNKNISPFIRTENNCWTCNKFCDQYSISLPCDS